MNHTILLSGIPGAVLAPGLSTAATLSSFLVSDRTRDEIQLATDLNGDGNTNDAGEVKTFFGASSASSLAAPAGNVFALGQTASGAVYAGDGGTDTVYRLQDRNRNGTADDAGEASVWFSGAANAAGYRLNTPNGIAEGPDGAIYVVKADTAGSPTGDWVYRTADLNGDGDANDAGEATRWLDLKALNAASSPFEIRFDGDAAYVIDSAGATPNTISRVRDHDGSGGIEGPEVSLFATDATTAAVFDFARDVGPGSAWTWQWLPANGLSSVFRLTDLDGSGTIDPSDTFEVWNTSPLDPMVTFLAGFGLALNEATGDILILSNAGADTGT